MNTLTHAKPVIVVCARDLGGAVRFYRDMLELTLVREDAFGALFDLAGTPMRVSLVADFVAHGHTVLGFKVDDVAATVDALAAKGVAFLRLPNFPHDARGVLALPGGAGHVAWMSDPDGNLISVTDS